MRKPKIAIIGAGSIGFTKRLFSDIVSVPELREAEFALTDISEQNLAMIGEVLRRIVEANRLPTAVTATTDRRRALEGAEAPAGQPPHTDGRAVYVPHRGSLEQHRREVLVQAALLGAGSLDPALGDRLVAVCADAGVDGFTHVRDGRFKGGHITRHFGRPADGWHAVQLEMAQVTYMEEDAPFAFDESRAARVRPHLRRFIETMADWAGKRA